MAELEPAEIFTHDAPNEFTIVDAKQIRDNLTALARTFYTTNAANPQDTREGQPRVNASDLNNIKLEYLIGGIFRPVLQNLQGGIAAPIKRIVEVGTAATTWSIDHNLGSRVIALVFDSSWFQLEATSLTNPDVDSKMFGDFDLATVPSGPVRVGMPLTFNGIITATYAMVSRAVAGPVNVVFDMTIDKTPNGGGSTPITGGTVSAVSGGALPIGGLIAGAPVTAANGFNAGDLLDIIATVTTPSAGEVELWAELTRVLNPGEFTLEQPTDNRIVVTHPVATSGFVVLIG